jgi:CheY-like chemotaxis protein
MPIKAAFVHDKPAPLGTPAQWDFDLSGIHVLVADDNAESCEILIALLRCTGAHVREFGSLGGRRAGRVGPDVIVSDLAMAGQTGWALISAVRKDPPAGHPSDRDHGVREFLHRGPHAPGRVQWLPREADRSCCAVPGVHAVVLSHGSPRRRLSASCRAPADRRRHSAVDPPSLGERWLHQARAPRSWAPMTG